MNNKVFVTIEGRELAFDTLPTLFSPSAPDRGSAAMLRHVSVTSEDKALDLGCGWGFVSASLCLAGAGKVFACDIDPDAVKTAGGNFEKLGLNVHLTVSDGLDAVEPRDFTLILSNPPYQTDFAVAKKFIAGSYAHLAMGGKLVMVTKRLDWYKNRLISVFGGVHIDEDDGYYVFTAEKRPRVKKAEDKKEKAPLSKKLARKYGK